MITHDELPAIIMEDNSAVVTMANNDSGWIKKKEELTLLVGPQLHQGADRLEPDRIAQDLWETQQRRHAHKAPPIVRICGKKNKIWIKYFQSSNKRCHLEYLLILGILSLLKFCLFNNSCIIPIIIFAYFIIGILSLLKYTIMVLE